jgi:putative ABC transport system permease protein
MMSRIAWGTQILVVVCLVLIATAYVNQRKKHMAALRVFGAPRLALFATVWLEFVLLVLAGIVVGMVLGLAATELISIQIAKTSGFRLPVQWDWEDGKSMLIWLGTASVASVLPSALIYRHSPAQALRAA